MAVRYHGVRTVSVGSTIPTAARFDFVHWEGKPHVLVDPEAVADALVRSLATMGHEGDVHYRVESVVRTATLQPWCFQNSFHVLVGQYLASHRFGCIYTHVWEEGLPFHYPGGL